MKTRTEIDTEVAKLKQMKPSVRHSSAFGDDHHAAMDAQIDVLENNRNENYIFDRYEPTGSECDEDEGKSESVHMAALDAYRWLHEESDDVPSDGWKELTQP